MDEQSLIDELAGQVARGERAPVTEDDVAAHLGELSASAPMPIGGAARLLGMLPTTIRYYEDAGLVTIPRAGNGHRTITPDVFSALVFIHRMRLSGMGIRDIQQLQGHLGDQSPGGGQQATALLLQHAAALRHHIAHLQITLAITEYKLHHLGGDPS